MMGSSYYSIFIIMHFFLYKKQARSLTSSEAISEESTALARTKLLSLELTSSWPAKPFSKETWVLLSLEELISISCFQNSPSADPTPTLGTLEGIKHYQAATGRDCLHHTVGSVPDTFIRGNYPYHH